MHKLNNVISTIPRIYTTEICKWVIVKLSLYVENNVCSTTVKIWSMQEINNFIKKIIKRSSALSCFWPQNSSFICFVGSASLLSSICNINFGFTMQTSYWAHDQFDLFAILVIFFSCLKCDHLIISSPFMPYGAMYRKLINSI